MIHKLPVPTEASSPTSTEIFELMKFIHDLQLTYVRAWLAGPKYRLILLPFNCPSAHVSPYLKMFGQELYIST